MFEFQITASDGAARIGELQTPHGAIQTPVFMPVGTHGAVKSVSPEELREVGSQIILANTYHMHLRPGDERVRDLGGLHEFMGWDGPILTDSGGFQAFSLGERGISGSQKEALRSVSENGVTFKSHLDGSSHLFTPEESIKIQQNLGADIIMAFDQPVYGMSDEASSREAMERSQRWLERSVAQWRKGDTKKQALFGIVQGGVFKDQHKQSAEHLAALDLPGNAIGGLAIGQGRDEIWEAVRSINEVLPEHKPRYFMGLGDDPRDLIEATRRGVDMYDCVSPARLARHGVIWQAIGEDQAVRAFWSGNLEKLLANGGVRFERWNLNNAIYRDDRRPLVEGGRGFRSLSRATLNHYLKENEMLGYRVLTMHNIELLHSLTALMRAAIKAGRFDELADLLLR